MLEKSIYYSSTMFVCLYILYVCALCPPLRLMYGILRDASPWLEKCLRIKKIKFTAGIYNICTIKSKL